AHPPVVAGTPWGRYGRNKMSTVLETGSGAWKREMSVSCASWSMPASSRASVSAWASSVVTSKQCGLAPGGGERLTVPGSFLSKSCHRQCLPSASSAAAGAGSKDKILDGLIRGWSANQPVLVDRQIAYLDGTYGLVVWSCHAFGGSHD